MRTGFHTLIKTITIVCFAALLAACGGSTSGVKKQQILEGTMSTGEVLQGRLYLRDQFGQPGLAMGGYRIDNDGRFRIDVTEYEPPFIMQFRPDVSVSDADKWLYSYAETAGRANVTPLGTLALLEATNKSDLETLFNSWQDNHSSLGAATVSGTASAIVQAFSDAFATESVDISSFDIFKSDFETSEEGFNAVLQSLTIVFDFEAGTATVNDDPFSLSAAP